MTKGFWLEIASVLTHKDNFNIYPESSKTIPHSAIFPNKNRTSIRLTRGYIGGYMGIHGGWDF